MERLTDCWSCKYRDGEFCEAPYARAFDPLFAVYPHGERPQTIQINHDGHCTHFESKLPKENTNG